VKVVTKLMWLFKARKWCSISANTNKQN